MSYRRTLLASANEFLRVTDAAYDECANGIATLDRIIVSVSSSLAPATRTYLLPILYAYWERFFVTCFSEFLRCLSLAQIPLGELNPIIAKHKLKGLLNESLDQMKIKHITELPSLTDLQNIKRYFRGLCSSIDTPVRFEAPEDWVDTANNVRYEVLERNCKNLGLDVREIQSLLVGSNLVLYQGLKNLVDARNDIAHGSAFAERSQKEWEDSKSFTLSLMNALQLALHAALKDEFKILKRP